MLIISFPSFDLSISIWIALVPLLLAIKDRSLKLSFGLSFLTGVVFFTGLFRWVLDFPGFTILHQSLLGIYVGLFFGCFALAFRFIAKRCGLTIALLAAPFLWVPLEYIRCNLSFVSLPWGVLAHSQHANPSIIQIASIAGAYGVSFVIVLVNAAIAALVISVTSKIMTSPTAGQTLSNRGVITVVASAASLFLLAWVYGLIVISTPMEGDRIKFALIQGNIAQNQKWDQKYARFIMDTYADLTLKAAKENPALIVWPETATPGAVNQNPQLYSEVIRLTKSAGTPILLGSAQYLKYKTTDFENMKYANSAFFVHPAKRSNRRRYDKIRLMPFIEYLPLKGSFPWKAIGIPETDRFIPGTEFTVFEQSGARFSATICWENVFPELVRNFVRNGAQFIVNITNEAWFGKSAAPYQFLSMSVFRAVENRVYVVRCANTGISCFIDPYGRIVSRVQDEKGDDIFVRGILIDSVIPMNYKTLYTRYGDLLVWICGFVSVALILGSLLRK